MSGAVGKRRRSRSTPRLKGARSRNNRMQWVNDVDSRCEVCREKLDYSITISPSHKRAHMSQLPSPVTSVEYRGTCDVAPCALAVLAFAFAFNTLTLYRRNVERQFEIRPSSVDMPSPIECQRHRPKPRHARMTWHLGAGNKADPDGRRRARLFLQSRVGRRAFPRFLWMSVGGRSAFPRSSRCGTY